MKQLLNFGWSYIPKFHEKYLNAFPKEAVKVDIPHTNLQLPFNYFDETSSQFVSSYELIFDLEKDPEGKSVVIHFEAVMAKVKIYLNDHYLGQFISAYLPFEIDITEKVVFKHNRLVAIVDSSEDPDIPPFGDNMDYITYGGIYREVYLEIRNLVYIEALEVIADHEGHLEVRPRLHNPEGIHTDINYQLFEKEVRIAEFSSYSYDAKNIKVWDNFHPNLYTLKAELMSRFGPDEKSIRFGFRSVKFEADGFYLNGQHIKLVGLNRHQSFPYIGYAAPQSLQENDADILKYQMGVNIVRSSHYPPSEYFLNRCDEIGLLVFDEAPGWQFIGKTETWRTNYVMFVEKMMKRDFNHPSVICEGVRINESPDDHELYTLTNKLFHDYDPNRPTGGVRNFKHSELLEDVYTYNDFHHNGPNEGLEKPSKVHPKGSPYLITEYNGHMYPTKSTDNEAMRVEQTFRHLHVLESVFKYPEVSGGIGWVLADYNTHKDFGSGDHVCYHGVTDMFRIPKYAASAYASQQDVFPFFSVLNRMSIGEFPEAMLGRTIVLTNCDHVELYKNGHFINKFYPDIKSFSHLPHAPVIVDDYIGDAVEKNEKFRPKDAAIIKEGLRQASIVGFAHLPLKTLASVGLQMVKYHLKYDDLVRLWNIYVSNWGQKQVIYTFKGIKDGKVIAEKNIGPSLKFHLEVVPDKTVLADKDTYDATRVVVRLVDEFNQAAQYTPAVVKLEASTGLQILGPSSVALIGGTTGIYLRNAHGFKGISRLRVVSEDYGTEEIEINIM